MKLCVSCAVVLLLVTTVCTYNPCTNIFKRINSPKRGELLARLDLNNINSTQIRLHITFTDVVHLQGTLTVVRNDTKSSLVKEDVSQLDKLITQDNETFIIIFGPPNINQSHSVSVNLNILYPGQYIDVSSIKLNDQSLCSDAEICGVTSESQFLIHKGSKLQRGDWPWQAALHKKTEISLKFFCAGTLVSSRHVVTAAHCIRQVDSYCKTFELENSNLVVLLGIHKLFEFRDTWTQTLEVSDILVHHEWGTYKNGATDADVAVLLLAQQAIFNKYVKPACLNFDRDEAGTLGRIVGWGLNEDGNINIEPTYTTLPIVSNEVCRLSDPIFQRITTNRTFCAGSKDGSGPCQGDSGGGFFTKLSLPGDRFRYGLTGIISRSVKSEALLGVCDLQHYAVFTRLSSFKHWTTEDAAGLTKLDFNHRYGVEFLAEKLQNESRLAEMIHNEGNYTSALDCFNKILESQRCLLGDVHRDTLNTFHWKANTLEKLQKYGEALEEFEYVVDTLQRVLGTDTESTLLAMHNKAFTLGKVGCHNESLQIYNQVIEKRKVVLGHSHPDTILSMHNKAVTLEKLRRLKESIEYFDEVISNSKLFLGNDHNETIRALFNKASALDKLGLYNDSLFIYDHVIQKQQRNLGEDHADTLKAIHNKATALSQLGRYEESIQIYDTVIEKRKHILGDSNKHTLASMQNKAATLIKLGRYNEAQQLYNQVTQIQKLTTTTLRTPVSVTCKP